MGLREGRTFEEMTRHFVADFGISTDQAANDIAATVDSWSSLFDSSSEALHIECPRLNANFSPCCLSKHVLGEKHVCLEIDSQEFVEEIEPRLAHLRKSTQSPDITFQISVEGGVFRLFRDGTFFAEEQETNAARVVLLQEMARAVQPGAEWLAILHAGACGHEADCIVLAANTNKGKSTLTAALMHSGLRFLADDSVAIERRSLTVSSMPFALMLREGSWPVLASRFPELSSAPVLKRNGFNVRFLAPPVHQLEPGASAKCILFTEFKPGAAATLDPLTPFESLLRLENTGLWIPHERRSIESFLDWIQKVPAYDFSYSNLDEATALIRGLLLDSAGGPQLQSHNASTYSTDPSRNQPSS